MALEQKFAFLCERADDAANANRSLKIDLQSLLGQLIKLDAKLTDLQQPVKDKGGKSLDESQRSALRLAVSLARVSAPVA